MLDLTSTFLPTLSKPLKRVVVPLPDVLVVVVETNVAWKYLCAFSHA